MARISRFLQTPWLIHELTKRCLVVCTSTIFRRICPAHWNIKRSLILHYCHSQCSICCWSSKQWVLGRFVWMYKRPHLILANFRLGKSFFTCFIQSLRGNLCLDGICLAICSKLSFATSGCCDIWVSFPHSSFARIS